MQKIIRNYVIITSFLLCLTFLVTGIIGVNQETSYVISGEKEEVLRVQSTTSERLLVKEGETEENLAVVSLADGKNLAMFLASVLPAPFGHIAWIFC